MAEYYPLLAKAVGSLPNSTPESRRVVYERARKALIGQLRTLHPPVPDEDIDRESVALDQAVERLEAEMAAGTVPAVAPPAAGAAPAPRSPVAAPPSARPASDLPETAAVDRAPALPATAAGAPLLRTRAPAARRSPTPATPADAAPTEVAPPPADQPASARDLDEAAAVPDGAAARPLDGPPRVRAEMQRPVAPQAQNAGAPKRQLWILFAGIGAVVILAAAAAYKLRDTRESVTRKPAVEKSATTDSGKIAERVGGGEAATTAPQPAPAAPDAPVGAPVAATPTNPAVPVAYRAALLVEAPAEQSKVKTFLGTVVWKLINVGGGPGETVGTAVEADIELPDDKTKAVVTFEKNTDASLPASHTVKVRFTMQPGSFTGDVQQISVPQLRQEDSPGGDALAGVTVPVIANSFLVGLSPGNAEAVNLKQLKDQQWIDIPMLLANGKIAKLTFEKGEAGTRDLNEAIALWSKP